MVKLVCKRTHSVKADWAFTPVNKTVKNRPIFLTFYKKDGQKNLTNDEFKSTVNGGTAVSTVILLKKVQGHPVFLCGAPEKDKHLQMIDGWILPQDPFMSIILEQTTSNSLMRNNLFCHQRKRNEENGIMFIKSRSIHSDFQAT